MPAVRPQFDLPKELPTPSDQIKQRVIETLMRFDIVLPARLQRFSTLATAFWQVCSSYAISSRAAAPLYCWMRSTTCRALDESA